MPFRSSHLAFFAATLAPLAVACGDDKRPATTTISSSPATVAIVDSGSTPAISDTAPRTPPPVSYADAAAAYAGRHYAEAVNLFAAYTRSSPENAWGHYMLALSSWKAGDPEQAIAGFDEALRLDPQHRKSLLNSARVLLETSRPREALERIERAMSLEPLSAEGLRLLGRVRYELKQVPEAIEAYRQAIVLDERDGWAMNNLGLIYLQQDRSDAALPILARAVELRSNSPVFQNNFGTALERTGRFAAAKQAYEAALAADSTYGKAAASLARVSPHAESDTAIVDLAALATEFQAEVERWRDSTVESDSVESDSTVNTDSIVESDSTAE
ncbi:MAG: tetratricopeptide repeat protein [Gemmatimonadales bacterium]|nr:tetratricopeptide repeat protein [Gemmatimonadales bacterium]